MGFCFRQPDPQESEWDFCHVSKAHFFMYIQARILVVANQETTRHTMARKLERHGCEADSADVLVAGTMCIGEKRPDLVLIDLQGEEENADIVPHLKLADRLKSELGGSPLPIIVIGGFNEKMAALIHAARDAGRIDDAILDPIDDKQIFGRINSLTRLNTMREELVRRLDTTSKYGVEAPDFIHPPKNIDDATILVLGAHTSFQIIENALSKHATLVGALTPGTALDYMLRRDFDAVIIDVEGSEHPYLEFCQDARRNSQLYNTPIVMIADPATMSNPSRAFDIGITDILSKPVRVDELQARILSLVKEMRFRDALREIYSKARHLATSDGLTGLYSRGFLLEHLSSQIENSSTSGKPLTVAFFNITNIHQINARHGYAVGDRIIRQVGDVMGMLVRGEDLTARYSGARFCVILPDTIPDAAKIAVKRIAGVVNYTEFSVQDVHEPIRIELGHAVAGYRIGDSAEVLISRARKRIFEIVNPQLLAMTGA